MTEWHFEEKVYHRWMVLMIGPWEDLIKELKAIGYKYVDEMETVGGINVRLADDNNDTGSRCTIIWMPDWSASVLAHELVHLVMHTFNQCQVPISIENEEPFGFYMEYWTREINRVYKRYPKGRSVAQARK